MENQIKEKKRNNYMLLAVTLVLTLVFAEIALNIFYPARRDPLIADEVLLYKMQPGGEIDENGFRNTVILPEYDIVVIGDSQTYGNSVSWAREAWPQILGKLSGKSVYNMAVAGYGPLQYLYLSDQAVQKKPEEIIWGIYLGNDLYDAYQLPYVEDKTGHWQDFIDSESRQMIISSTLTEIPYRQVLPPLISTEPAKFSLLNLRQILRNNVRLYALAGDATRGIREALKLAKNHQQEKVEYDRSWAALHPDLGMAFDYPNKDTVFTSIYRYNVLNLKDLRIKAGYENFKKALILAKNKLNSQKIKFTVVIIPTKESVYKDLMKVSNKASAEYQNLITAEADVSNLLLEFCRSENINCFSLLEYMTDDFLNSQQRFYPRTHDGHPLQAGNLAIAEAVKDILNQ